MPDVPAEPILTNELRERFKDALAAVPVDKKGQAGVAITNKGLQFEAAYKPKSWLDISGYAGREWKTTGGWKSGWTTGARVGVSWK